MSNYRKGTDFTEGIFNKKLIKFVLPIIGAYLIQQAYSTADLYFAGNFLGKDYAAAVGSSTLLVTLAIGLLGGLSAGAGILFARVCGSGNISLRRNLVKSVAVISLVAGGSLTIIAIIAAEPVLELFRIPDEVMGLAVGYIRIYMLSLVFMTVFNMTSGMLRAKGESKFPMIFQIISGGVNVLLDYIFVVNMPDRIEGLAVATLISQAAAAVMTYIYFIRQENSFYASNLRKDMENDLEKNTFLPRGIFKIIKRIFSLGLPIGIQSMLVTLSNVFVQANINTLGVDTIAAFAGYFKIELFIYYPILAFGQAVLFAASQNIGAGKCERVQELVKESLKIQLPLVAALSVVICIFAKPLFYFITPDENVVELGSRLVITTVPFYFMYVFVETFSNVLRAAGKVKTAMIIALVNFAALRAALLIIFERAEIISIRTIGLIYPLTWLTAAACYYIFWKRGRDTCCELE